MACVSRSRTASKVSKASFGESQVLNKKSRRAEARSFSEESCVFDMIVVAVVVALVRICASVVVK